VGAIKRPDAVSEQMGSSGQRQGVPGWVLGLLVLFVLAAIVLGIVLAARPAVEAISDVIEDAGTPSPTTTTGAAPSGLQGRFVGIDVEIPVGSYWEVTFSPNGRWEGIDSATNVCEGFLSRTWGEFWETDTPNALGATINVECLEGPNEGTVFNLGEFSNPLIYDPVEDTILVDTTALPEGRDVTFCRIPCDPYDYYAGPYG
jgi:hypothetical protein